MKINQNFLTVSLVILVSCFVYGQNENFMHTDAMHLSEDKIINHEHPLSLINDINTRNITNRSDNVLVLDSIVDNNGIFVTIMNYDLQNRIELIEYRRDNNLLQQETVYSYKEDSDLVESIQYGVYSIYTGGVTSTNRGFYFYNSEDQVSRYVIDNDNFETGYTYDAESTYTYDSNGNLSSVEGFGIDQYGNQVNAGRSEYFYDQSSRIESVKNLGLNPDTNTFTLSSTLDYVYDAQGLLIQRTRTKADGLVTEQSEFIYDTNGNRISSLTTFVNSRSLSEVIFDTNVDVEDLCFPTFNTDPSIVNTGVNRNQVLGTVFSFNGNETGSDTYFWSRKELSTSILGTEIKSIKSYPNPVSSTLQFQNLDVVDELKLTVYDLLGRRILDDKLMQSDQQVDVSSLINGSYFFTIREEGEVLYSGRFVKN